MVSEVEIFGLGEEVDTIEGVETARETARQFKMLFLVFTDGYFMGFLDKDVDSHEGRVGEKAGVDALVGLGTDNLPFDILGVVLDAELFAGFVLESCSAHKFSDAYMHVEQEVHFGYFRNIALDEYGSLFWVDASGEIFSKYVSDIFVESFRVGSGSQCVKVGYEEETVIVVLHPDEFPKGSIIVSEVEISGRTDA